LVLGFMISGTGAAVAVSGISGAGSAGEHEYPVDKPAGQTQVLGDTGAAQKGGKDPGTQDAQAAEQVAVTGEDSGLPFTGFAAIPLLLVGVGLTTGGLILRRPGPQKIG
jgi:hypothetical protein